jgi:hypothetical protein
MAEGAEGPDTSRMFAFHPFRPLVAVVANGSFVQPDGVIHGIAEIFTTAT